MPKRNPFRRMLLLYVFLVFFGFSLLLNQAGYTQLPSNPAWEFSNSTQNIPYTPWGNYGIISGQQFPFYTNWGNYGFPSSQQFPLYANWESYRLRASQASPSLNTQGHYGFMASILFPGYTPESPYSLPPSGGLYYYQSIVNPKGWIGSPMPPAADPEEQYRREAYPDIDPGRLINGMSWEAHYAIAYEVYVLGTRGGGHL